MIIIIGSIEAVRKAAAARRIPLPLSGIGMSAGDFFAPFTRRRLSDLRAGKIFYGLGSDPSQAVMIAEPEKETPVKIILPDTEEGDTEISLHDEGLENRRLPDLLADLSFMKMLKSPWLGQNLDVRA
jgi:hypothetical protein